LTGRGDLPGHFFAGGFASQSSRALMLALFAPRAVAFAFHL
jgi:hypothetical protein